MLPAWQGYLGSIGHDDETNEQQHIPEAIDWKTAHQVCEKSEADEDVREVEELERRAGISYFLFQCGLPSCSRFHILSTGPWRT